MTDLARRLPALPRLLDELAAVHGVPGASVGVLADGEVYVATTGVTSLATRIPVTPDTLFQIGSNTKPMTATVVLRLVDDGVASLDDPITRHLPEFRLRDVDATEVTVRHLLSHQGGFLGDYPGSDELDWGDDCIERYVAELADVPQLHPVGRLWSYANSGMVVLGRLVEKVTGQRFDRAVESLLLDPLGAAHTRQRPERIVPLRAATGHRIDVSSGELRPVDVYAENPWRAPSGSMVASTPADMLAFAALHLSGGVTRGGERLLTERSAGEMRTAQVDVPPLGATHGYGLGWAIRRLADGTPTFGHGGATAGGQVSAFELVPGHDVAVVAMANAPGGKVVNEQVVDYVLEQLTGAPMAQLVCAPDTRVDVDPQRYVGYYDGVNSTIEVTAHDTEVRATITTDLLGRGPAETHRVVLTPVSPTTFLVGGTAGAVHFLDEYDGGRPRYASALGRIFPRVDGSR